MDRSHQSALAARLLDHHGAGTQDLAQAVMYQSIGAYRDPAQGVRERELVKRWPVAVAHGSELPQPGDFVTDTIAGTPVLVVRQTDGTVRTFVNLCRHRATQVEWEASGSRRLFTCPYHAWSYERHGALRNIPVQETGFPCVDKTEHGLTELPCQERHGIVWAILTPGLEIDIAAYLGPELDAELAGWGLDAAVQDRIDRFDNGFNWKLAIDGFLEGYHLRFLHAKTIGPYILPDLCLHDEWGPHSRLTIARKSFLAQEHLGVHQIDLPTCTIPVYILFPATILVWQNDHWELWTSFPDARDTTRSTARARLMAPDANSVEAQRALWDKNWRILMDTVEQEDWQAMRYFQEGIDAAPPQLVFGRNEPTLQYFHRTLAHHTTGA